MTPDRSSSRRYSDEEVRRLLQRAAELEREDRSLPASPEGPTLADLEGIAAEAGLDPVLLRQAARELDAGGQGSDASRGRSSAFLGAPLVFELERVVEGEAPDSALERLLPAIQRAADGMGHPSVVGRTLTWQSTDSQKARILQVAVSAGDGETRILIEERYQSLAGELFGGILGGVGGGVGLGVGLGVGIGALGSALFATLFPLAALGGAYAIARTAFRGTVRRRIRTLNRLMEEMLVLLEDGLADQERRLESGE
jgi:hypothetical protein